MSSVLVYCFYCPSTPQGWWQCHLQIMMLSIYDNNNDSLQIHLPLLHGRLRNIILPHMASCPAKYQRLYLWVRKGNVISWQDSSPVEIISFIFIYLFPYHLAKDNACRNFLINSLWKTGILNKKWVLKMPLFQMPNWKKNLGLFSLKYKIQCFVV